MGLKSVSPEGVTEAILVDDQAADFDPRTVDVNIFEQLADLLKPVPRVITFTEHKWLTSAWRRSAVEAIDIWYHLFPPKTVPNRSQILAQKTKGSAQLQDALYRLNPLEVSFPGHTFFGILKYELDGRDPKRSL